MSVNKVILIGRLGQTPEVRYTPSGAAVGNFSVATNESWQDKSGQKQEKTEWHKVVVWGKTAENCSQYLSKGRQVYVEGRLQTRQWQDKEGQTKYTTEIQAQTVEFLGAAGAGAGAGAAAGASSGGAGFAGASFAGERSSQSSAAFNSGNSGDFGMGSMAQSVPPVSPATSSNMESSFTEDDIPF